MTNKVVEKIVLIKLINKYLYKNNCNFTEKYHIKTLEIRFFEIHEKY